MSELGLYLDDFVVLGLPIYLCVNMFCIYPMKRAEVGFPEVEEETMGPARRIILFLDVELDMVR